MFGQKSKTAEFFNLGVNMFFLVSSDFHIKEVNQAFTLLTGYDSNEASKHSLLDFINQDDRASFETEMKKVFSSRDDTSYIKTRFIKQNNETLWLDCYLTKKEKFSEVFVVAVDKTEEENSKGSLLKINRQIAEDKARIDAMLKNIGEGIIGVTDKGEIYYINQAAEDMLGIKLDLVLGRTFIQEVKFLDEKGNVTSVESNPLRTAMNSGNVVYNKEMYFENSLKEKFPVAVAASPVILQNLVIGGVIIFRDITREKEIDRMKTEFISLASHQLRTPLSAMKWFSEMLIDGDLGQLSEEQMKVIRNINKSNQRMIELVNSLLNISRIESGRLIIDPEPTFLKEIVDEIVVELQPKIEEKHHKLIVSVHGDLPKINVDPKLIRHVYMNLLTNAIKYTNPNGEITVLISKNDTEIISQVSDNGLGIPKAQQDRIFDKFFRADNVVRVVTDGTGLGLYLIKAIVESSGGRIWFKSDEGKGTSFWFALPLAGSKANEGEVSIDS